MAGTAGWLFKRRHPVEWIFNGWLPFLPALLFNSFKMFLFFFFTMCRPVYGLDTRNRFDGFDEWNFLAVNGIRCLSLVSQNIFVRLCATLLPSRISQWAFDILSEETLLSFRLRILVAWCLVSLSYASFDFFMVLSSLLGTFWQS